MWFTVFAVYPLLQGGADTAGDSGSSNGQSAENYPVKHYTTPEDMTLANCRMTYYAREGGVSVRQQWAGQDELKPDFPTMDYNQFIFQPQYRDECAPDWRAYWDSVGR